MHQCVYSCVCVQSCVLKCELVTNGVSLPVILFQWIKNTFDLKLNKASVRTICPLKSTHNPLTYYWEKVQRNTDRALSLKIK